MSESVRNVEQKKGTASKLIAIGGVATAIAAILGLIFLLVPDLRPTGAPKERYSTIGNLGIEHNVVQGGRRGILLSYQLEMKGQKGETNYVVWSVYNADTGMRVPDPDLNNQGGVEQQAEWDVDRGGTKLFVPYPARSRGNHYVTLEVYDNKGAQNGTVLTSANSPPFQVR